jgi:hypothetical protein
VIGISLFATSIDLTHRVVMVVISQLYVFFGSIGMKYAVVWMKNKKKGQAKQQAIFYNLDDASMWEQHINKTEHAKTNIIPIFSDS